MSSAREAPQTDGQFPYLRPKTGDLTAIPLFRRFWARLHWDFRNDTVRRLPLAGNKPGDCGIFSSACRIVGARRARWSELPPSAQAMQPWASKVPHLLLLTQTGPLGERQPSGR